MIGYLGFFSSLGIGTRIGIWVVFIIFAFQLWRALKVGSRASSWIYMLAVVSFTLAVGLASGIITGIDVELATSIIADVANTIIEFGSRVVS